MIKFIILTVGLFCVSCTTAKQPLASESQIVEWAKREIAERESWSHDPYIVARKIPYGTRARWLVSADVLDCPIHTDCDCRLFDPKSSRELVYSESGRLVRYERKR